MRVYLDNQDMGVTAVSLADGLKAGVAAAEAGGRVVIEMKADGAEIGDAELERAAEPTAISELRLVSADARTLVRVTLHDAADALAEAKARQDSASELVQAGETQKALDELQEALGLWQLVRGTLDKSAELLSLRLEQTVVRGPDGAELRLAAEADALKVSLGSIKAALETQDWSALSDALSYDMDQRVATWQRMLRALGDDIAR